MPDQPTAIFQNRFDFVSVVKPQHIPTKTRVQIAVALRNVNDNRAPTSSLIGNSCNESGGLVADRVLNFAARNWS